MRDRGADVDLSGCAGLIGWGGGMAAHSIEDTDRRPPSRLNAASSSSVRCAHDVKFRDRVGRRLCAQQSTAFGSASTSLQRRNRTYARKGGQHPGARDTGPNGGNRRVTRSRGGWRKPVALWGSDRSSYSRAGSLDWWIDGRPLDVFQRCCRRIADKMSPVAPAFVGRRGLGCSAAPGCLDPNSCTLLRANNYELGKPQNLRYK